MQEFLRNNTHSKEPEGPKTRAQGSRNRRRSSRTRPAKKSQVTAKAKQQSSSMTREMQIVPVTRGFGRFSSESKAVSHTQQSVNSLRMMPSCVLNTSAVDVRKLTYAERMNDFIAQAVIEDNENDHSQSPPTLSHVYSSSPVDASSEPHHLGKYETRLENVSNMQSVSNPSTRSRAPCIDALTPCKAEVEVCDDSPMAKRRLFPDVLCVGTEAHSDGRSNAVTTAGQIDRQNGYHTLQKFFTSSLNGKSLGPVGHYEDGLLAIANAACLMSTGVSDGHRKQAKVSEERGSC